MTMHLMSPAFTTTGKQRGKKKFRTAEHAAKSRRNAEAWKQLLEKYDVKPTKAKPSKSVRSKPTDSNHRRTIFDDARSVDTGIGVAAKKLVNQYTGDAMIGIGVLHKSNSVPIFKQEDAEAISKMRRG